MNLLVDAHVFDGKYQGTRTYIEGLYSYLTQHKDIDFYFAACNVENLRKSFGEAKNVHYIPLQCDRSVKRLALEFPKLIRKYAIDYAHFQYISPLQKCCKEIVTVHDLLFLDFPQFFPLSYRIKNSYFFKRSAKRADLLLTVSNYSKEEIVRHFGIQAYKIHVIPNGVTLPASEAYLPEVKKKYGLDKFIMTVSRLEPRKNHQMLLQAYVELELYKRGYKLLFVGTPDLNNTIFNTLYNSLSDNIKEHIIFKSVPYLDLISLYKNASLFVFPSFAEGFGIPPIEAAAAGCTILCSDQTAMADFDFFGDKLFNPYNLNDLKRKMAYYLENGYQMIKEEKKVILERYNWQIIADKFYDCLMKNVNQTKS